MHRFLFRRPAFGSDAKLFVPPHSFSFCCPTSFRLGPRDARQLVRLNADLDWENLSDCQYFIRSRSKLPIGTSE